MAANPKPDARCAAAAGQPQPDCTVVTDAPQDLLRSVWDEVCPQLSRLVSAMGVGHGHWDDVLQDVYLAAWQKGPAGADRVELRRWLFRVAMNRCRLDQRRRGRWRTVWQRLTARWSDRHSRHDAVSAVEIEESRELVRRALAAMDDEIRSLLVLRYFLELDSVEIGRIVGLPDSTVRGRLRAARKELARTLKQAGYRHE